MTRMVGLLFFLAVSWRADAQHLRGRVVQNDLFRGLVDFQKALKAAVANGVSGAIHEGSEALTSLGLEEEGGAPAKQVNTTAGGQYLVEELLSNKKLTKEVRLTPTETGWVEDGRIFNISLKDAHVGSATRVYIGPNGDVHFDVEDLDVGVECDYDLRLTSLDFGETGRVKGRLKGSGMTLRFPQKGIGQGSCDFRQGLDLEVIDATSDRDQINVAIDTILQQNFVGVRSEIVSEMEDGLCRALLAPGMAVTNSKTSVLLKPMPPPRSMWPLVIGSVLMLLMLLAATFFLGRCSAQVDHSHSKERRAWCYDEENPESSESDGSELVNLSPAQRK